MGSHNKSNVSIVDAVEMLANIADSNEDNLELTRQFDIVVEGKRLEYKTIKWLPEENIDVAINVIKESFSVVYNYIKNIYKKEKNRISSTEKMEGIKAIMVLVGEAAKKIDKNHNILQKSNIKSITELKEYKMLQDFYQKKIEKREDLSGMLGKWVLGLAQSKAMFDSERVEDVKEREFEVQYEMPYQQSSHIFVDFEAVRKDLEYELFFLRKEDGGRFFNPRLVRNIKLICNFGGPFVGNKSESILSDVKIWQEDAIGMFSKNILDASYKDITLFYQKAMRFKNRELVSELNKAIMALMLSSRAVRKQDITNFDGKSCVDYFSDFQKFLRHALSCKEYQNLLTYQSKKENEITTCLLDLCHSLCSSLFLRMQWYKTCLPILNQLELRASESTDKNVNNVNSVEYPLSSHIINSYTMLAQLLKLEPQRSLAEILDLLEEGSLQAFDPLFQRNLPSYWYGIQIGDNRCSQIRMPSPTRQEYINKAAIVEEFNGFLRSYCRDKNLGRNHLVFNLQDRTSWREHARSVAVEELQSDPDFDGSLSVITFATDTEFFHQLSVYNSVNHAQVFMQQLEEQLHDENSGFFFPQKLKKKLFSIVPDLLKAIHRVFFSGKNVLTQTQRMDFIEIFNLFLQLKILEILRANSFSYSCKDGIDLGAASSVKMFALLKMIEQENFNAQDLEFISLLLHAPAIFIRKRIMLPDVYQRMINTIKAIESVKHHIGYVEFLKALDDNFSSIFETPISQMRAIVPQRTE